MMGLLMPSYIITKKKITEVNSIKFKKLIPYPHLLNTIKTETPKSITSPSLQKYPNTKNRQTNKQKPKYIFGLVM